MPEPNQEPRTMTPRERIIATLNHELPDRTPTDGWFHHEVQRRLKEHLRTDSWQEVLHFLGIEGWASLSPRLRFPQFELRATLRPGPLPGRPVVWLDERTYEDEWGVRRRLGEGGWYEQRISGPLENAPSLADVEAYPWPSPSQIEEPPEYAARVRELQQEGHFVSAGIPNPYKQAWELRGMHNVLADYLANRDLLEAIYDRLYGIYGEMTKRMAAAGVDMITITGDIAMQDRLMMGPRPWREVDKPRLAKLIEDCRQIKPDVFFFIHSDGNVMEIMDDLVEIGFNVINPVQPECMDPVEVKRRWGYRITIHGGVSIQRTLPFGTPEEVRAEVEHLIRHCGYNGGLVVFPSNVIQPDTPIENIIACFHAARDFDLRSLSGKPN
jgi:uroporphyrinogen decarboxylase